MRNVLPLIIVLLLWAASVSGTDFPSLNNLKSEFRSLHLADQDQPLREVEIYPNPITEGRLTITASDDISSVQILNITGKVVFNQEYDSNTNRVDLELDKLEKGIYLVRINFPGKLSRTEKVMIK
jgi:hypothetical protein